MSTSPTVLQSGTRNSIQIGLACSVLAMAIAAAAPAHAQEAQADPAEAQDGTRLDEIIVTARKRTESIDTVPLSITAMTSEKIEERNLKSIEDVASFTPGFYTQQSTNSGFGRNDRTFRQLTFRGIGAVGSNISIGAGGVGFVDGAPVLNSALANVQDIERVEVLKGPQSAYFGRSTFIGAVNYITKDPTDTWTGRAPAEYAEDNLIDMSGAVSGPLNDFASIRISGRYFAKDGQYRTANERRRLGDQSTSSIAVTLLLTPSDNLRIKATYNHFEDDDGPPAQYTIGGKTSGVSNCNRGGVNGAYFCGTVPQKANPALISANLTVTPAIFAGLINNGNNLPANQSFSDYLDEYGLARKADQLSNRIDYTLDSGITISAVTAYHENQVGTLSDFSFRGGINPTNGIAIQTVSTIFGIRNYDWSQELRIVSAQDQRLRWLIGGNYVKAKQMRGTIRSTFFGAILNFGSAAAGAFDQVETPSVFGGVYFDVLPALTISAEGRYQEDKISSHIATNATTFIDVEKTFKSFSPRVTIDYKLTDTSTIYALYSRGNKPGGFNGTDVLSATPAELAQILAQLPIAGTSFDEETLENYEVGIKGSFLDGRLRVALDGYIGRYRGAQVPVSVVVTRATVPPTITTLGPTINIGNIDLKGVEFEAEAIIFPGFRVGATFAYTDTNIKRYYCSECSNILAQNPGIPNGPSIRPDSINYTAAEGKRLPGAPQITYTLSANYEAEVASDLTAYIGGDYIYRGKYYADAANITSSGDSELFNARLGLRKGNYNVELFARNLFDDTSPGIVYTALGPNAAPFSLPSVNGANIALPDRRRVGIRVSAAF